MLDIVIDARSAALSPGFEVARILPYRRRRMVGPFVFLDHAGPVALKPRVSREMDVLPHPHIGLSTITYIFHGKWMHRDSVGYEQVIKPGDVNWMTAGSGVSHSERFEEEFRRTGGDLELLQAWVALPTAVEESEPSFHHFARQHLPHQESAGIWMRMIAGEAFGLTSPVNTHSPLFYVHVELQPGARLQLPDTYSERAAYIARGQVTLQHQRYQKGQLLVFEPGKNPVLTAETPATVMLLGGEPLGKRHIWWNFVSSSKERIEQAKADWAAGRIRLPVHDDEEFIPLPGSPKKDPEPLS
ncbi:hypothetical protein DL240_13420 [Lujinxingia litoralis]|uniref:Pirin family protein n=1 Tax=Lujinxingia litoralis TaxID=2211119 RepID=A0A328C3G0_9DELT|nr:pirin family protein [Lujinxingia litoralis]RAL21128.1 hypothetical protein DL240_13420 [Lujinxingia litoralis]